VTPLVTELCDTNLIDATADR